MGVYNYIPSQLLSTINRDCGLLQMKSLPLTLQVTWEKIIKHLLQLLTTQVNPSKAPQVVGQLLDDDCPEDFIRGLILSVRSLLPVEPLVEECEKRYILRLLHGLSHLL